MLFVISLQYMSFKIELSRICHCSSPCHLLPSPPAWIYYIEIRCARRGGGGRKSMCIEFMTSKYWQHCTVFFLKFLHTFWIKYLGLYSDYKYHIHRMFAFTSIIGIFVTASTKSLIKPFILTTSIWIYIPVSAKTIFKMLVLAINLLTLI